MGRLLGIALTLTLSRKRERGQRLFSTPIMDAGIRGTLSPEREIFSPLPLAGEGRVRARPNHRPIVQP